MSDGGGARLATAAFVMDRMFDAVLVVDEHRVVIGRWETSAGTVGVADADVVGSRILERLHPDDLSRILAAVDRINAGAAASASLSVSIRHPVDVDRWMAWHVDLLDARAETAIGGLVVVARLADAATIDHPGRGLIDAVPFGVAVLDGDDGVAFVNPVFAEFSGLQVGPVTEVPAETGRVLVEVARLSAMARAGHQAEGVVAARGRTLQLSAAMASGSGDVVLTVIDITRRMAMIEAQARSERTFAAIFDNSPTGIAIVSLDGEFLRVNDAFCTVAGRSEDELIGGTFAAITHPADLDADLEYVRELLAGSIDSYRIEKRYIDGLGHPVWVDLRVALVRNDDKTPLHFISQIVDITERKQAEDDARAREAALTHQATHDHLTGLPNRVLFEAHFAHVLRQSERDQSTHALLVCDLDRFKPVNDVHGHAAGDQVLRILAQRIQQTCRAADLVARLGGDEFAVIAFGLAHPEDTGLLAARLVHACARAVEIGATTRVQLGVSIGVTVLVPGEAPAGAIERADAAAYQAKRNGGGFVLAR